MKRALIRIPKSAGGSLSAALKRIHGENHNMYHILPTKENIKKYKNYKKVILLREPSEVIDSIKRGMKEYIHGQEDLDKWSLKKVQDFYDGWVKQADENTLLIQYKELISVPKKTLNKIEKYWGLPISKKFKLPKVRYSRGILRRFGRMIYYYLRKIPGLPDAKRKFFPNIGFAVKR